MTEYKKLPFVDGVNYKLYTVTTHVRKDTQADEGSHIHDAYEIYVNLSGDVSFLVNNKIYPLSRGNVIVTRPGDVHICIHNSDCDHEHFCLWLQKYGNNALTDILDSENFSPFYDLEESEEIVGLTVLLSTAQAQDKDLTVTTKILSLLEKLSERKSKDGAKTLPVAVQKAINYIEENYSEIKSVNEVASSVFVSVATLSRLFKKHLSITPKEFLLAKRLSIAKRLLDGGAQVTDVAMRTGFSDTSHFIEVFKQKFNLTPYKYKKDKTI